ncbi:SDR family oxidoreductase [Paracoccus sp. JM45]|uniref:SDR family NAD(P)-dependent oxidoreductase n=1 Tax=Paracoccus sp. JM45 TaxID=2283626 RepID=UPI000E6D1A39|nr:SDR family NAD(P)-dependent oxidoreductase [Paracoccus sp. JM45]RJE80836.1 SDR family NAD(P)-dependent oxidoreductase [Paracoccus sp. JM45]
MNSSTPERIWIIGASDGIGLALAKAYSAQGAHVILSARSQDALDKLAAQLGNASVQVLDVSDRATVQTAADAILAVGPVDRIIHLAAMYDPGRIADLDPDKAAQIVTVNLTGSFHIAQIGPKVLRKGGQLALTGSVAGYVGLPQGQIYSASKAGVINLAESLRAERKDLDIRLICPGFVETRLTQMNEFKMPAIMKPEAAAKAIVKGLASGGFEVHFPHRLTRSLKFIRALPYGLSMRLTRRLSTEE